MFKIVSDAELQSIPDSISVPSVPIVIPDDTTTVTSNVETELAQSSESAKNFFSFPELSFQQ